MYQKKYLKYKRKYLELRNKLYGGASIESKLCSEGKFSIPNPIPDPTSEKKYRCVNFEEGWIKENIKIIPCLEETNRNLACNFISRRLKKLENCSDDKYSRFFNINRTKINKNRSICITNLWDKILSQVDNENTIKKNILITSHHHSISKRLLPFKNSIANCCLIRLYREYPRYIFVNQKHVQNNLIRNLDTNFNTVFFWNSSSDIETNNNPETIENHTIVKKTNRAVFSINGEYYVEVEIKPEINLKCEIISKGYKDKNKTYVENGGNLINLLKENLSKKFINRINKIFSESNIRNIYIVRHGNAFHNQGFFDDIKRPENSPLTPYGILQAFETGIFLNKHLIKENRSLLSKDIINTFYFMTSDLIRAELTMLIIIYIQYLNFNNYYLTQTNLKDTYNFNADNKNIDLQSIIKIIINISFKDIISDVVLKLKQETNFNFIKITYKYEGNDKELELNNKEYESRQTIWCNKSAKTDYYCPYNNIPHYSIELIKLFNEFFSKS